jgi:hypothetical protein
VSNRKFWELRVTTNLARLTTPEAQPSANFLQPQLTVNFRALSTKLDLL